MEGVTSQPQAVTAGKPTHVKTGKLFSHFTCEETRVYTPAAAKVHSSIDHALAHSPVSSGSTECQEPSQHKSMIAVSCEHVKLMREARDKLDRGVLKASTCKLWSHAIRMV